MDETMETTKVKTSREEKAFLDREQDIAADYIERFLDIADLGGDLDLYAKDGRSMVEVIEPAGENLDALIGPKGATLEALQELTRMAVGQQTGERCRLILDIGGYRQRRQSDLVEQVHRDAQTVISSGKPFRLAPMNAFERKIVHDEIASIEGLSSESEGEAPDRRVVIFPIDDE